MEPLNLPTAYPGNRYSQTVTLSGVTDPDTITVVLKRGRGGQAVATTPTVSVNKTPGRGAGSQDVTFGWDSTSTLPYVGWLEISADGQVVRAGELTISYDHR